MHRNFITKYFSANNRILGEILGRAATDHKQARFGAGHLDFGKLDEIAHRVDAEVRLALFGAHPLVLADAEACRAVGKSGAENRHTALVASLDEAVFLHGAAVVQPLAKLIDELARAVGTGLQHIGQFESGIVAGLQFLLVDEGIIDTVDVKLTELGVGNDVFFGSDIMFKTKSLKEIHIDN